MNGFRNWFSRYMMGRYGSDELNRFLLIIAAAVIIAELFFARRVLNLIAILILIVVYSRMLSRNIGKRQRENMKFLQLKEQFTGGKRRRGTASGGGYSRRQPKAEPGKRVYICPNCKGALKVPVGAGKIRITCPHCGSTFEETV